MVATDFRPKMNLSGVKYCDRYFFYHAKLKFRGNMG